MCAHYSLITILNVYRHNFFSMRAGKKEIERVKKTKIYAQPQKEREEEATKRVRQRQTEPEGRRGRETYR